MVSSFQWISTSGWWFCSSATGVSSVRKLTASRKSLNWKRFEIRFSSSVHLRRDARRLETSSGGKSGAFGIVLILAASILWMTSAPWETRARCRPGGNGRMYFTILVIVHVAGAIMGIGPSFGFAVLGAMADKGDDATKLTLFRAMTAIDSRLVTPVALVTQPVTGALLIFNRGINHGFFAVRHLWLIISIVFYIAI